MGHYWPFIRPVTGPVTSPLGTNYVSIGQVAPLIKSQNIRMPNCRVAGGIQAGDILR